MRNSNKSYAEREHERIVRAIRRNGYKMTPAERRELVKSLPAFAVTGWAICRQGRSHRKAYRNGPNPIARGWGGTNGVRSADILEENGRCYVGCRVADSPIALRQLLGKE